MRFRRDKTSPERLERLLMELKGLIVVVEGRKDKAALVGLGLNPERVIPLNGKPLLTLTAYLKGKQSLAEDEPANGRSDVVILTDFDSAGRQLASQLKKSFQRNQIKTNGRLRKAVMTLGKTRIEDFGNLDERIRRDVNIRRGIYGEVGSYFDKIHNKGAHKGKRRDREA